MTRRTRGPEPDGTEQHQAVEAAGQVSPPGGESRYRPRRSARPAAASPRPRRVLRLTLTEPDTVPMTEQQHQQAVAALAAMIVAWLQRRALDEPTQAAIPGPPTKPRNRDGRTS
ncbi:hypothetical protein WEI85_00785 [Actinomycetes bacterium KLBMP 9797]